ncbi:zinc-binding dehydrogenase [Cylindrospermum sp. FACHB-282]|uniref:zinc-binding dehydrogenase n=1 Tax=Cylindrospermum sp. FACHB-282 TaxID=2692794 RepID=UPI001F551AD8|nr:zinc-binding dehydrogenase [Cylindrospermum sp. FACHB-282]
MISTYNADKPVPGPYNYSKILIKRLRLQGFIVTDYLAQFDVAFRQIGQWLQEGKIKYTQEMVEGLENAPQAILKLFNGDKTGKLIVTISEAPR